MKKIIFIPFIFLCLTVFGQKKDTMITYSHVVNVPHQIKDSLFQKAKNWFAATLKNSEGFTQNFNEQSGELSGNSVITVTAKTSDPTEKTYDYAINFETHIYVKDNQYKYVFTNFYVSNFEWFITSAPKPEYFTNMPNKEQEQVWNSLKKNIESNVSSLTNSLKKAMREK